MMRALPTVLLTGAPGVGKTAVAKEMGELLLRAGVRHAVIDLDALGEASPPCADGTFNSPLVARNLAAIWPNYRDHGVDRLVLARIVGGSDELFAYRSAVPEADMKICRIIAPASTVTDRLMARETGVKQDFLLRITHDLGEQLRHLGVEDFTVQNGPDNSLTNVALEVLGLLGWPASVTWRT
jgi:dephospho-CoA kinase